MISPSLLPGIPAALEGWLAPGVRPGLDAMRGATRALGHPEGCAPMVLVAGTNGKGSTAAFIAAGLSAAGLKVGAFTSPAMGAFADHIAVSGAPPSAATLEDAAQRLRARAPAPLSAFEAAACLAWQVFAAAGVDVQVVEVGMGGLLDATNVGEPLVSVVTTIALDHVAELGPTVADIARHKAGILRPGRPLVSGVEGLAGAVIAQRAQAEGALLRDALAADLGGSWRGLSWRRAPGPGPAWTVGPVALGLAGAHQVHNAAVALEALACLHEAGIPVGPEAAALGLLRARVPGRLERLSPGVWLDGAHNPAGALALAASAVDVLGGRPWLVFGAYGDKAVGEMLAHLAPVAAGITLVPAPSPRAAPVEMLTQAAREVGLSPHLAPSVAAGISDAQGQGAPVLVCGSLSLWAPALAWARGVG